MSFSITKTKIGRQWRPCRIILHRLSSKKCWLSLIIILVSILVFLHFYLLPIANGSYNSECYLHHQDHNNLRHAIQMIGRTMEKHNVTYWLDYGEKSQMLQSRNLKSEKGSVWHRKTLVSPSRKVSILPFLPFYHFTIFLDHNPVKNSIYICQFLKSRIMSTCMFMVQV